VLDVIPQSTTLGSAIQLLESPYFPLVLAPSLPLSLVPVLVPVPSFSDSECVLLPLLVAFPYLLQQLLQQRQRGFWHVHRFLRRVQMMAEQAITWRVMYLSVEDWPDRGSVMVPSLEKALMGITRMLGSSLEVNLLFGIFAALLRHIILVPVMRH
jgi:hypothetical protein